MNESDAMRYFNREDYKHALEIYLDMIDEAEREGDIGRVAYNANLAGMCLYFLHMYGEARKYFEKALENSFGDERRKVERNLQEVDRYVERLESNLEELEYLLESEEDEVRRGIILSNLGILKYLLGQNDEAEEKFREAEKIFRKKGDKIALGAMYSNFALIYDDMRKLDYLYLALDIFIEEGHIKGQIDTYHALALYYLHRENLNEAYYFLKKEIELFDKFDDSSIKRRTYELAADLAMDLGLVDEGMRFTELASGA